MICQSFLAVLLAIAGCLKKALSNALPLGMNYPNLVANLLPVGRAGFQVACDSHRGAGTRRHLQVPSALPLLLVTAFLRGLQWGHGAF